MVMIRPLPHVVRDRHCDPLGVVGASRLAAQMRALRHQVAVLARSKRGFRPSARLLRVILRRLWPQWRVALCWFSRLPSIVGPAAGVAPPEFELESGARTGQVSQGKEHGGSPASSPARVPAAAPNINWTNNYGVLGSHRWGLSIHKDDERRVAELDHVTMSEPTVVGYDEGP
jgi:hypothetical protein